MLKLFRLPIYSVKYHFNARWYDAETARFVSEDPALFGSNWYRYAAHNPLKYTDPTGLHDWYDPGGDSQSGPSYEYTDAAGDTHNQTTSLPGKGEDPGLRDNMYDYQRVLEALGYSEQDIALNPDLSLGESEYLWRDAGCLAWGATINLMFAVQNLGGSISLDEAIIIVNDQISSEGLLDQTSISNALQMGIVEHTAFSEDDFTQGNISVEWKEFGVNPIGSQAIDFLNSETAQEGFITLALGISKVSLLPDISPGTHFVIARGFDVTTSGLQLEYIGTSKNDDITQNRNYVFYSPRNQALTYEVQRLDLYLIRYPISSQIIR
jgi:hypothetical protein